MRTVTAETCDAELGRQLARFEQLVSARPTHIDSHHCHPGYVDGLESRYAGTRERELETLTDPRVRAHLDELGIELVGWQAAT